MRLALLLALAAPGAAITAPKQVLPPTSEKLSKRGGAVKQLPITTWLPALRQKDVLNDALAGLTVAADAHSAGHELRVHRWAESHCGPVLLRAHVGLRLFGCVIFRRHRTGGTRLHNASADDRLRDHRSRQTGSSILINVLVRHLDLRLRIERPRRPRRTRAQRYFKSAFVTCCAFNIAGTQIPVRPESRQAPRAYPSTDVGGRLQNAPDFHSFTASFSALTFAFLVALKRLPLHAMLNLPKSVPHQHFGSLGPFLAMVLGIVAEMKIRPEWEEAWPRSASCRPDYRLLSHRLTRPPPNVKDALVLSFVALTETLAMGKALAERASQKLDTSQEILAVGAANVAGSAFQSYTVAGVVFPKRGERRDGRRVAIILDRDGRGRRFDVTVLHGMF